MAEPSIAELSARIETLEREFRLLRAETKTKSAREWAESVSGSMKDIDEESYNRIVDLGSAIRRGELEVDLSR